MSKHGTTNLYNKGCRCDPCKSAKSAANLKYRETVLKPERKERVGRVVFNFDDMLSVLIEVRNKGSASIKAICESLRMSSRTVNRILCDLLDLGFIKTGFNDGYYVYSPSEKTTKTLGFLNEND